MSILLCLNQNDIAQKKRSGNYVELADILTDIQISVSVKLR